LVDTSIPLGEYAARRKRLLKSLDGAVGIVMAGDGAPPLRGEWFPNFDFVYLTGIRSEPGAVVVFDPSNPDPKKRIMLLLKPVNPEADVWDGYRPTIGQELRDRTGFDTIQRTDRLAHWLLTGAKRTKRLACLHPLAPHTAPVSPDLAVFQALASRVPGCVIEDRSDRITAMRMVKSAAELGHIRAAIGATHAGIERVIGMLSPDVDERDLHNALLSGFASAGAKAPAFNPIVGSGIRSTILHYKDNDRTARAGDLLVLDSGAEINGYAADITRTFPVGGTFTPRQREIYELVLKAQRAAIRAVKPGATMVKVDEAARRVIRGAGYGDAFMHGTGHHLGLETHDPGTLTPLKAGMVVTIEPGIYLPDEEIGVRIEDDILVTKEGSENLSSAIPKSVKDIEALLARR